MGKKKNPSDRHHFSAWARIHNTTDQILNTFDTRIARWFNVFMIFLIVGSTVFFVMDSMAYFDPYKVLMEQCEAIIAILFTVEYVLRIWVAPRPKYKYVFSLFAIFDLLAILPFYLGYLPLGFLRTFRMIRMLRVIRVLRVVRLMKLERQISKEEKEKNAFAVEMQILAIAFITVWLIYSAIMYEIEGPAGTKGFESVLSAMWYVIVTITTVGYGDVYPVTAIGKIFASIIMLSGIGMLGTLTGIIGKAMMSKLSINQKTLEEEEREPKEKRGVTDTLSCSNPECKDMDHVLSAKFCKTCGTKLMKKAGKKK